LNSAGFPDYLLNGLIPFNSGVADAFGSYWYMDGEMAGWDSPDGRVTMLTKIGSGPNADGEIPADQHYRGRTITFTLYASSSSETDRENSRLLLAQALDLVGTTGTLDVNEAVPKSVIISRSGNNNMGKLVMTDQGLSATVTSTPGFTTAPVDSNGLVYPTKADIEVYAADPRKYSNPYNGPSALAGNTVTITNAGTTDCTNFFLLLSSGVSGATGPLDITLVNANGTFVMTLAVPTLPAGAPALSDFPAEIAINFYLNTIEDNMGGNYYYLRDLTTPWLVLAPGSNVFTVSGLGAIAGDVTWYDAWI
jgi:hypothetical protein